MSDTEPDLDLTPQEREWLAAQARAHTPERLEALLNSLARRQSRCRAMLPALGAQDETARRKALCALPFELGGMLDALLAYTNDQPPPPEPPNRFNDEAAADAWGNDLLDRFTTSGHDTEGNGD